jgi:hypothetical protein
LVEAARLEQEAAQLIPTPVTNVKPKATKKTASKKQAA